MQEKLRALLVRLGAAGVAVVTAIQGALDVHIPAVTAVVEANPNGAILAVAGYFIALHLAKQNS